MADRIVHGGHSMGTTAEQIALPAGPFRLFPQSRRSAHREALALNKRMCAGDGEHRNLLPPDDYGDVFCRCGEDMTGESPLGRVQVTLLTAFVAAGGYFLLVFVGSLVGLAVGLSLES